MLACKLPIIAARIGVMSHLLSAAPACLYHADAADDLARAALAQLDQPMRVDIPIQDWAQIVFEMEEKLGTAIMPTRAAAD
jgi:hypothetical protein